MKQYWIDYTNGERAIFLAASEHDARDYFMLEGDHALDYGIVEDKKPRNKRGLRERNLRAVQD